MNDDLCKLVFFLLWAEKQDDKMMFGGYNIDEVVNSLANIMKVPSNKLRELVDA